MIGTFKEKDRQINFAIVELEKIKAEVCEPNEMEYFENSNVWQKWFCDLIDKHISKLKGSN